MTENEKFKIQLIIEKAFTAARLATDDYLKKYPDQWFPCGFAWVRLDGRSPLIKVLKENFSNKSGHKGYPKGWEIWNPSDSGTQCMDAKMAGAEAFAKVLNEAGYDCYADCRMD